MSTQVANDGARQATSAIDLASLPNARSLDEAIGVVNSIGDGGLGTDDAEALEIISSESQAHHFVRTGDIGSLARLHVPVDSIPPEGISQVTHSRSLLVSLNAICLHAALDGGVSKRTAYALNLRLAQRIQACDSMDDLLRLADSQVIPLSYCLLVSELTMPGVTDKDVSKAIRYVQDHQREHLTVRALADHVGLSSEYLTTKFRRETGMTASEYISQVRIREAKSLLRFTDLSVGEVAAQLSFSSQSHFQTAFKRATGMTPQQYRASSQR